MVEGLVQKLEYLFSHHSYLGVVFSFFGGLLSSLSPCVYPFIPITLGIIGVYTISSKSKSFFISFIFVLGIATFYTSLGVVSASLGIFLGKLIVNPLSYTILGIFLLFFAVYSWNLVKFPTFNFSFNLKRVAPFFCIYSRNSKWDRYYSLCLSCSRNHLRDNFFKEEYSLRSSKSFLLFSRLWSYSFGIRYVWFFDF
ncbi:MAG: hypothetical protein DRP72_01120 [Candidatus Omnitrophota bacterium]|nr:MAG: hypothetical protein DRP72_01120 [Candidatus Omnitrophota bacterium]